LFRLCQSAYREQYLLKGAQLFWIWNEAFHRPTLDVDLLGIGNNDVGMQVKTFQEVCLIEVDDGLVFDIDHIQGMEITEDAKYQGVRINGFSELARARIPFQIDIGFGDIVTPDPETVTMPSFLDLPVPEMRAYPVYSVIAEKFQTMIYLGVANSRMKDFYDVWFLASNMRLDGALLAKAVKFTFDRRETSITSDSLPIFEDAFAKDRSKNLQWTAFLKKNNLAKALTFEEVLLKLQILLEPVYQSIANEHPFSKKWSTDGWQ